MKNDQSKVVWITGASSGIGEHLAYHYSNNGYMVILSARRKDELERVQKSCPHPDKAMVLPLDLVDIDNFPEITKQAIAQWGGVDVLVNNGGISQRSLVRDTSLEIDRKVMEVNYFGNTALTKALLPHFSENKKGHIVVITSLTGKFGFYLRSAYAASKHALHGFYESLRLEEEDNGLKVTLVSPGFIRTDISKNALTKEGVASGKMDGNQDEGMLPAECARQIYNAQQNSIDDIVIGKKERMSVLMKRLFPKMFKKILKKQSATG